MTDQPTTVWVHDFDRMREAERDRCRTMPDVSALAVFDALREHLATADISAVFAIMRALGRDCEISEEEVEAHFLVEVDEERWRRDGFKCLDKPEK